MKPAPTPPIIENGIDSTLAERGARYSPNGFTEIAKLSQSLKRTMRAAQNWPSLPPDARESLEMIQLKIARILSGDPTYRDNWHDILGYAKLIDDRLAEQHGKHSSV